MISPPMTDPGVWCKCLGTGYWTEQIDGIKVRTVRCPWQHELQTHDMITASWNRVMAALLAEISIDWSYVRMAER